MANDINLTEISYLEGVTSSIQTQLNDGFDSPTWASFTPTVTLVGGAGNTVPTYVTNSGRYISVGKIVFVKVALEGDGGTAGAGTGQINIALPIAASANNVQLLRQVGYLGNVGFENIIIGYVNPSGTTILLKTMATISTTANVIGTSQAGSPRAIHLDFSYEID